jgi:hypothetical protein
LLAAGEPVLLAPEIDMEHRQLGGGCLLVDAWRLQLGGGAQRNGGGSLAGARRQLQRSLGPLPWQVAVDTLRRGGEGEEAERERRKGLELPLLAGVAEQLRKKLVVVPVPRLVARGAGRRRVG